jgi:hypothetical protein
MTNKERDNAYDEFEQEIYAETTERDIWNAAWAAAVKYAATHDCDSCRYSGLHAGEDPCDRCLNINDGGDGFYWEHRR